MEMMKRFCNYCGKELHGTEYVGADVTFRIGLPYRDAQRVEFCKGCVDSAFGEGFTARLKEECDKKQAASAERRKAREEIQKQRKARLFDELEGGDA